MAHSFAALAARAVRASIVLIGEASHGTQDFYAMRADEEKIPAARPERAAQAGVSFAPSFVR
jgi:hypothetical protein